MYKRQVISTSDFLIRTTKETAIKPLILPVEAGNKYSDLQYTSGKWGKLNAAPYFDAETDLSKSTLPFEGSLNPVSYTHLDVYKRQYQFILYAYSEGSI